MKVLYMLLATATLVSSCSDEPSHSDIEKKLLMEYVCPDAAKVNNMKITETRSAEGISGAKGYNYTVSGEVEWTKACDESINQTKAGFKEKFENKTVVLIKGENGWQ